jgi:glutamate carboxypeptidase
MASLAAAMARYLAGRREAMVDLLQHLVTMESPSTDPAAQQPLFEAIGAELEEVGYVVGRNPGVRTGGSLSAAPATGEGSGIQLLVAHCDTVWPTGTLDEMPVERKDGRIRGPGAYDTKAGIVQGIFALRAVHALGAEPPLTPVLFVNSDEEIGSPESTPEIERLAGRAGRALVLEPSMGPAGHLKTRRKGGGHFEIVVSGRAAHAGLEPGAGASAILELSYVIQRLFALNDVSRGTTVNVGVIDGGMRANVVAPRSRAVVDVRVQTMAEGRRVEEAIRALEPSTPGTGIEVRGGIGKAPMEPGRDGLALFETARSLGRELGLELEGTLSGGMSDGNTTSLFTPTLDGLGAVGDGAHARHEYVSEAAMPERAALLGLLLLAPA